MTPGIETSIWLALKARINELPLLFAKAWPGETFQVPSAGGLPQPFLRIGRVTVAPVRRLIADGQPHERAGSLMVTLVHPLGQEVAVYDQMAASIAEHFRDGTQMHFGAVCLTVTSHPHAQEGYEDTGYWTVPVAIPWRCFA